MNWIDYVKSVAGNDKNAAIGYKSGVTEATVSRWGKSAPKPENVAAFARSYRRPVLEAFVAAGYLTPEEANEQPTARPSLTDLSSDELIHEIARRLKAGEQGATGTPSMNNIRSIEETQKRARKTPPSEIEQRAAEKDE